MVPADNGEASGTAAGGADSQRSLPTPFLTKTYQLVDDKEINDVISWNDDGSSFIVWNPMVFARDLLPKYFKHNNYSSFVRQLNTYGFRKVVPDRWEFSNDCFRRGEKRLLCDIQRRKVSTQVSPAAAAAAAAAAQASPSVAIAIPMISPSNSGEEQVISGYSSPSRTATAAPLPASESGSATAPLSSELMEENERLRKENSRLKKELSEAKGLVSNIFSMVSSYSGGGGSQPDQSQRSRICSGEKKPLDLLPTRMCSGGEEDSPASADAMEEDEEGSGARLFGVAIGVKRGRSEGEGEGEGEEESNTQLQLQQPGAVGSVKSEPLDSRNGVVSAEQQCQNGNNIAPENNRTA